MMKYESLHCSEPIQSRPFLRKLSKITDTYHLARLVRVVAVVMSCLILAVSASSQIPKPTPDDVVRIDTDLILIPVTVFDRDGRYLTGLTKDDFQIFEEGVRQDIAFFAPVEKPITVLLLLDVSSSMTQDLGAVAKASSVFVSKLRPDDQLAAATFSWNVEFLFAPTKLKELKKVIKLRASPFDPETLVYDAVEAAMKKLKKVRGRKAIVLFSDGMSKGLSASAKSNLRDAEEQETIFYNVQYGTTRPTPFADPVKLKNWIETATSYMSGMAETTGGRHFLIEDIADLESTFELIVNELGKQYSLGYYPGSVGKNGERRKIKVKVNVPNAVVRSRNEVIYKKSKQ